MALTAAFLCSGAAFAQDPFDGGFSISLDYGKIIATMGEQNDSLQGSIFDWLSDQESIVQLSASAFPDGYQCGDVRDFASADFNGDYMEEIVMAWNRSDGGVFVGIPTYDLISMVPLEWNTPDPCIDPGVLYATDGLAEVLGEIRVAAGNFYDDEANEFVLAYLAADSTVTISVFDIDGATLVPIEKATISDQAVNTDLPVLQQFGAVSRFDIATGDFDGDALDEIALIVSDPAQSPETDLVLRIYDYDPLSHTLIPKPPIPYAANSDVDHTCLRNVLIETGNFEPDSLDEIAILDSWSRSDVDSSRVGTLHTLKLDTAMAGIDTSQKQSLPSCSWQSDAGLTGSLHLVMSMTIYNGELIVGGAFNAAGGISANNIASWDGARWKPLGAGVNVYVEALEVYEGDLIVGGSFTEAGGVPANRLARWDGSSWEEFGGGANYTVNDLLVTDSVFAGCRLFACGGFTEVNGESGYNRIARWDGSEWHTVGSDSGLNGPGYKMIELNDGIVVTGNFNISEGCFRIANWDPGNPDVWNPYERGINSVGYALANVNGSLVVGGDFWQVWQYGLFGLGAWENANRIAYWTGSFWNEIGSGLNDRVNDLLFNPADSNLYIGGQFTTAGGINASRIARWHWPNASSTNWYPLGSGLTGTGTVKVADMCFYDGDLIAGGYFDHAGGIAVSNIARWNQSLSQWHALSNSPPMLPIGLAVGRFNADSGLDEIAITACASDLGYVRRYLRVYGVDTEASPLTLSEKGETEISGDWNVEELARSRRLIAVDDITGDGQADLAVLSSQYPARIEIYEPCDAMNNCTFDPMPQAGSWNSGSVNLTQLVLANLDTATIELGAPSYHNIDSIIQPLVVLNVPPVHVDYDAVGDTIWDVSERYPWPPAPLSDYRTWCAYGNRQEWVTSVESVVRKDWGISAGLQANFSTCGATVKAHLNTEYGEGFSEQGTNTTTLSVIQVMEAHADDMILAASIDYDIWEYPVYRRGERLVGADVVVVDPSEVRKVWMSAKEHEAWISDHEVENIFSYARYPDLADNPMVASEGVIQGDTWLMMESNKGSFSLKKEEFEGTTVEESNNFGVEVGASLGYEGGLSFFGQGAKFGVEVSVEGTYDQSELNTYTTTFTTADSIHVQYGNINSAGSFEGNRKYEITPYAYWAKNGALVLDYAAGPIVNVGGEDPNWWQINYSDPDPAFILPWRLDPEKDGSDPSENRYKTREIVFIPKYPDPGGTVLIIARVHNFSLNPTLDPVKVSFYLGDPDHFGQLLYDKNTGDSLFWGCDADNIPTVIASQGEVAAQMVWQVPTDGSITECQRIWALIDPLDEISPEVHDNDAEITNNKGWNLLRVNTTNNCYDPDVDGWVAPAYRCCNAYNQWDNCPDVWNDDQTDTDGDGIGDACEDAVCGDANRDFAVNVGDAVYLISYIFKGGPPPDPVCAGDANGDASTNVGDAVYLIAYVFKGGPPPLEGCCP